jgi:hypothetical protein
VSPGRIKQIIDDIIAAYLKGQEEVQTILREEELNDFERESFRKQLRAMRMVVETLSGVSDLPGALDAQQTFMRAVEGFHDGSFVMPIIRAERMISEEIVEPFRPEIPREGAREAAVSLLAQRISPSDKAAILSEIASLGIEDWKVGAHFGAGMAVRNTLRGAGFSERTFGVSDLDEIWLELFLEALKRVPDSAG